MGLLKKKPDPISDRARFLNRKIAQLEAEIERLSARQAQVTAQAQAHPRLRSTAVPHGPTVAPQAPALPAISEPVFEELDQQRLKENPETATPEPYNELGVRKYDFPAAWHRFLNQFRGPPSSNPTLVNYLAAGSVQGLRPLRYEKRVARNRVLFFSVILSLVLLGLLAYFIRHN